MCNTFYYRKLICLLGISYFVFQVLTGQQNIYDSRSIDLESSLSEGLYDYVLSREDAYEEILFNHDIERQKAIALLHSRYPDLTYELERIPKQMLSGTEISQIMVQILKEETAAEVANTEDSFWSIVEHSELNKEDEAIFQFLYAYELFKQKRFSEADKVFNKIIKARKGEYEYAFYYSGLIALIEKNYDDAEFRLKKIGKNELLSLHTPYYLAAAHYGKKDYTTIVKYYEPRINQVNLHNQDGLIKIVAYAQFKTGDFNGSIASINTLQKLRPLSAEENYLLGIAYQKSGDAESSSKYLSDVTQVENKLSSKAAYENALNLAAQGKNGEALTKFEELLTSRAFNNDEIIWNLAVLNGRLQNYDKLAFHAISLLEGPRKKDAIQLLSEVLNNVENDPIFIKIATELYPKLEDRTFIKTAVYNRALVALQQKQKDKANSYFDLLATIDPLVEERGVVAAWRGIMAFENNNYTQAVRLLTNYSNSRSADKIPDQLDFDASYFLAYSHFKLKNHSSALGHFSQSLAFLEKNKLNISNRENTLDDIFLRLGDSYFLLNEYQSAERAYGRIIEKNGNQKDYALWQKATIAELEGRPYDQIIILDEIIEKYRNSKFYNRAIYNTANALFTINRFEKAATLYNKVVNSEAPQDLREESTAQLGLISVNAGEYDRAEKYFKQLISTSKNDEIIHRSHIALKEIYADYTYDTDAYLKLVAKSSPTENNPDILSKALFNLAQENFEKGKFSEAISQYNKLVTDFPDNQLLTETYLQLAKSYEALKDYKQALSAYLSVTAQPLNDLTIQAFSQAEHISYSMLKDYSQFLEIKNKKRATLPTLVNTASDQYKETIAHLNIGRVDEAIKLGIPVFSSNQIELTQKKVLLNDISSVLINRKNWDQLLGLYNQKAITNIVNKDPKLIYQRSLAYFNSNDLDKASVSITDHYDTLLETPAWLAKGIILISDIYILKNDTDSATAALEALIDSKSNIPPGLIDTAKERLKNLNLQN